MYNWEKYTVLLVEDDDMSYRYMELVLTRRTKINVIWAKNGKEAINYCKTDDNIDIVLMDLQLPDINGCESTISIKSFKPFLPIIMQTANSWNEEKIKCFDAGCDGYVTKPINLDILFSQIDTCIKKFSTLKKKRITS